MLIALLALFFYGASSFWLAHKIEKKNRGLAILLFLSIILGASQLLGVFSVFNKINLVLLGGFLFSLCLLVEFATTAFRAWKLPSIQKSSIPLLSVWLFFFIVVGFFFSSLPLTEIDSLAYHLPIVTQFIKTQGLWDIFHAGFVGPNTYFPGNHEVFSAFFTALTGNFSFNFVTTMLGLVLFCAALGDMTRKKIINRWAIFSSVIAVASIPFLFQQLLNYQVDLFLFTLFGTTVAYLIASLFNNDIKDLGKSFLALGLVLGTKYNGVAQAVILIPLFLLAAVRFRTMWRVTLWFPLLTFLTGGFFYIRNFILTNNPIYPFGVELGPLHFEGHRTFLENMTQSSLGYFLTERGPKEVIAHILHHPEFQNLIGTASLFFIPMVLIGLTWMLRKKLFFFIFLFLFMGEMIAYGMSPYTFTLWNETIRYASAFFALIPILFVFTATFSKKKAAVILIFSLALFVYNVTFKSFLFNKNSVQLLKKEISADDFLSKNLGGYENLLPIFRTLRKEKSDRIALAGLTPYGLFIQEGFEPWYVNIDGCLSCTYHHYRYEEKSIRSFPNREKWIEALEKLHIRYLLVGTLNDRLKDVPLLEEIWAQENPRQFQNILKTDRFSLYSIRPS